MNRFLRFAATGLFSLWVIVSPWWPASAFALRTLEQGAKAPDLDLMKLDGGTAKLSSLVGEKGLVVIYWATWSSRSPGILLFAEKELRKYEKLGLNVIAVNADHQEMKAEDYQAVRDLAKDMGLTLPVFHDKGLVGYNALGIISTPTTLILDKSLSLKEAYPGFPSVARTDIPERIDAILGIVRPSRPEKAQYLLDHKPKNYALQYYNLGKRLFLSARSPSGELRGGVPQDAIDRLDEAIKRDPDFFRPYLLKAIIYDAAKSHPLRDAALDNIRKREFQEPYEHRVLALGYLEMGMDDKASDHLKALLALSAGDPAGLFGQAVLSQRRKDAAGSKKAVTALSANPAAKEVLGEEVPALFTLEGAVKPGSERAVRDTLQRLLDIEKKGQGMIRSDAPVKAEDVNRAAP
ncbi:MAG TPA: redoxin domain-containing protein [Candidatus Methylomirabilis sp.]|nr:redoxin domain-containing protein [Candidatus Methylomirabilis sp.]